MILKITTLYFLFLSITYGQIQILKKYEFEKGGYSLLGIPSSSDPNSFADSLGQFYTNDINILNEIKKHWVFMKPSPQYASGYHYEILICKNGIELERFSINLNCNEIASKMGYFYFETEKLRMFKNNFKKSVIKTDKFASLIDARNFRNSILNDTNLIFCPKPDWTKYEGTFRFTYLCTNKMKDCFSIEEKLLVKIKNEITNNYPNEDFEIESRGGSSKELYVEVRCNKSLSDKFGLYKRDLKYHQWEPYNLYLQTYWIMKPNK